MAVSRAFLFFSLIFFFNDVSLVRGTKTKRVLYVSANALVTARPGDNVTLPCSFKMETHIELSLLNVRWSKDGVTKYFSNKTCCAEFPDYDITEEDLQNGKATLQLINVQETDAGVYTCSIKYDTMQGSRNTTFLINGKPTRITPTEDRSSKQAPVVTTEDEVSVVPESAPQYRTLKYSLVSGVVAVTGLVAIFVYFCFEG